MRVYVLCPFCKLRIAGCQRRLNLKLSICTECKTEDCFSRQVKNWMPQMTTDVPCVHCKEKQDAKG